jgi:hypothetical protein
MREERYGAMKEPFEGITAALESVTRIAERLPEDSGGGSVLRSARQLKQTFVQRESIEPAVSKLQDTVSRLSESVRRSGSQPRPQDRLVNQLDTVIAEHLLPELRRVGFDV